ncbi:MAG: DUF262 domain-containing protein [Deltaproteobacteria bacterium]|nr:DUF262 domain-containing protein [Deltaproteobacteria bacterium]
MPDPELRIEHAPIESIVQSFRSGKLAVPEFQRDYQWGAQKKRAAKLVDSLYRKFPVSALLVWEPDSQDHVVARRKHPRPNASTRWLIDGQQRVITLSNVIDGTVDVVFNPWENEGEFQVASAATRKDVRWVQVSSILDDDDFVAVRRLVDNTAGDNRAALRRLDRLRGLLRYEVPVVVMVGHGLPDAVEAFRRINGLGVRLKKADLESAAVAAKHVDFVRGQVIPALERFHREGFERLAVTHMFRICAFLARPDARNRTPLHEMTSAEIKDAWKRTIKGIEMALNILRSELGLIDMNVLWSGALLVVPAVLCGSSSPRQLNAKEIAAWVALAAGHHRYSGSAETAMDQDLKACRGADPIRGLLKNLRSGNKSTDLKLNADAFSAALTDKGALFSLYVAIHHRGARDLFTKGTIKLQKQVDRHHIFPRASFDAGERAASDIVPNITFISHGSNQSLSDDAPERYLARLSAATLRSHCIPSDPKLWTPASRDAFFKARRQLLASAFNEFFKAGLVGRKKLS